MEFEIRKGELPASRNSSVKFSSGPFALMTLPDGEIVPRERNGVDPLAQLNLEGDNACVSKYCLTAREIEFRSRALMWC